MLTTPNIPHREELLRVLATSENPLLVVLGHTASGKTDFSINIAEALQMLCETQEIPWQGVEIINADSRQLYRGMDIGTAKITESEKRGVVHHLFDVLDPKEPVTIAWYKEQANRIIFDCHERHVIPMLVGGSMLYISAVIDGLEPLPSDSELRIKLEAEYDVDLGNTLMKKLEEMDPEAAAGIDQRNKVYLVRAVEIALMTEEKLSLIKRQSECPYDVFLYGLAQETEERTTRIHKRTEVMLKSGWIEEVQSLLEKGYTENDPGMKSTGYKEIIAALKSGEPDLQALAEDIAGKTRKYAKRQMTWWKGDERIKWMPHLKN